MIYLIYPSLHSISAEITFYNELAHSFVQAIQQADEHPIILIISSCKSKFIQGTYQKFIFTFSNVFVKQSFISVLGEPKLSNLQATRYFINPIHETVEDLRNALLLANWHLD